MLHDSEHKTTRPTTPQKKKKKDSHLEKDRARDYPRQAVAGDDEEPDAPQVGEEEVDVLEGHVLVSLPHGAVDLDIPRRSLGDLRFQICRLHTRDGAILNLVTVGAEISERFGTSVQEMRQRGVRKCERRFGAQTHKRRTRDAQG